MTLPLCLDHASLLPSSRLFTPHLLTLALISAMSPSAFAQESVDLDNLIISASSTEHDALSAPAFTTVITQEEIMDTPSNSLADLIGRTSGAHNMTDSSGRDNLSLRGMDSNYTVFMVNGKRVSSADALWRGGDFDYSAIPLSAIERVEVVRGPMSSLYGADAMGGVINIITKKPTAQWQGQVDVEYRAPTAGDNGDQLRTNLYTAGALSDTVSLSLSAELSNRDPWYADDDDNPTVADIEEKNTRNLQSTLSWAITDEQILDVDLMLNKDDRPLAAYGDEDSFRDQSIERTTLGLTHKGEWDWGRTTLSANYEDSDIDDYNNAYDDPMQRHLKEENLTLSGSVNKMMANHNLTVGVEYRDQTIKDKVAYFEDGESSISQASVYAQDEIGLTDRLTLTLGGRYDDHEIFGGEFTPRGYLVYQVAEGVVVKGGVSQAFKAPDAYQLNSDYRIVSCGGSCYIYGDENLSAETSTNYELGIEVQQEGWGVSAVYFVSDVEDMITATRDAVTGDRMWINEDQVDISGIELNTHWQVAPAWLWDLGYAYTDTEDQNGDPLPNRPRQTLRTSITWQPDESFESSLTASYTGDQDYYGDPVDSYTTYDLALRKTLSPNWTLRGGINNITNVNLYKDDDNASYTLLGRNLFVSASYRF